ncbi:hypothetical protein BT96DRAFT_606919 [Gymnopus androsaceus JB14]|uniref:Uncharacterized protein n=1 Tax=Gymnopus androsaceus JB14 TaxID=1447944 RepID=A0A6A4HUA9_9AGAR|nr:hypothetical protein BT96DRAFT_606919 [Gymnopus androsaceus JB14]
MHFGRRCPNGRESRNQSFTVGHICETAEAGTNIAGGSASVSPSIQQPSRRPHIHMRMSRKEKSSRNRNTLVDFPFTFTCPLHRPQRCPNDSTVTDGRHLSVSSNDTLVGGNLLSKPRNLQLSLTVYQPLPRRLNRHHWPLPLVPSPFLHHLRPQMRQRPSEPLKRLNLHPMMI